VQDLLSTRTTLLAGISHDLRTPLARMRLAVEILRDAPAQWADGLQPDEASAPYLAHLERDIAQMNQLIGELLVLARGLESEPPQEVDVPDFLAEMATEFALALPDGPSPMPLNVQPCRVNVPPLALRRALGNLLQNAQRYAPAESVSLVCEPLPTGCRISVLDRGPGIADEQLPKMLQPFQRLEPSRSPASGGFGLGLAIVKALAAANGWQFVLRNREGGGLAACLVLPKC
jgi:two-component system osmolarity sensor histidine kinase EnvZ